jgi:hypothetical protein
VSDSFAGSSNSSNNHKRGRCGLSHHPDRGNPGPR